MEVCMAPAILHLVGRFPDLHSIMYTFYGILGAVCILHINIVIIRFPKRLHSA